MARRAVLFDPAAVREAHAAYLWYRSRSEAAAGGVGHELDAVIETLASNPRLGAPYLEGTRRILLRRYPFSIMFRKTPESTEVIAVAHTRRRPGYWLSRT